MVDRETGITVDVRREGLRFQRLRSGQLTQRQFQDVQDLRWRHYIGQHIDRMPEGIRLRDSTQVGYFVGRATLNSMRDLNTLVGSDRRNYQRYARQMLVLVTDGNGELQAGFRCEDNVRSRVLQDIEREGSRPGPKDKFKGKMEMAGKLHVPHPKFVGGRHFVLEEMFHDPSFAGTGIELVAAGVAAEAYRDDQPVAAYPFREEEAFIYDLRLMGLTPDEDTLKEVPAFGQGANPAVMERWSAKRLDDVRATYMPYQGCQQRSTRPSAR